MEEIEVGEYVRTDSKIRKVTNPNFYMQQYIECGEDLVWRNDILKHSPNIIDLIEVGDYVNGYKITNKIELLHNKVRLESGIYAIDGDIKSIVTHEQFTSMEYKVGE